MTTTKKLDLTELKEKLPALREMFAKVPAILLGTRRLPPNEAFQNDNRYRLILDTDFYPGWQPTPEQAKPLQELFERVLSGAPYLICALLQYTADLESCKNENILLRRLCGMMFDPENQPPQWDHDDAWHLYQEAIGKLPPKHLS